MSDAELAWEARASTGLSQRAFARLIGAHKGTVAEWESGRGQLSRLTRSLLRLVATDPSLALSVLKPPCLHGQGERRKSCACELSARVGRAARSPHPGALGRDRLAESACEALSLRRARPASNQPFQRASAPLRTDVRGGA